MKPQTVSFICTTTFCNGVTSLLSGSSSGWYFSPKGINHHMNGHDFVPCVSSTQQEKCSNRLFTWESRTYLRTTSQIDSADSKKGDHIRRHLPYSQHREKAFSDKRSRNGDKQYCAIVTLYFENAFNSAKWERIKQTLDKIRTPKFLQNVIASYLTGRVLKDDIDKEFHMRGTTRIRTRAPPMACYGR